MTEPTPAEEQPETTEEAESKGPDKLTAPKPTKTGMPNSMLSRPSDMASKPGFRNPANLRSKASKKRKKRCK